MPSARASTLPRKQTILAIPEAAVTRPWFRWPVRGRVIESFDGPLIMGILNVTPDSFSDGGEWMDPDTAIAHALALVDDGAGIIDIGGESTRPGAAPVTAADQLARVLRVVDALSERGVNVSIDTTDSTVAAAALDAGALVVNDVSALGDPDMAPVVAAAGAGVVLMHMQGTPRTMQRDPRYDDVVAEVRDYLVARADAAVGAGIDRDRVCIDPGIGFGKTAEHNLAILRDLGSLVAGGFPVVLGTSRKRFLGSILGGVDPAARDQATAATSAIAALAGISVLRVHNVAMSAQAARTGAAIVRGTVLESTS